MGWWGRVIEHKMCVWNFSTIFSETFMTLRIFQADIVTNVHRSACLHVKYPSLSILMQLGFSRQFSTKKNSSNIKFVKIRPVGA
jgi:hypothetical protein